MKLITRDTDYAIRALCYIAKGKDELVSVSELVRELNIPRPFLRKILQILNNKGILNSHKGKGGGFSLALPPDKIFLNKLLEAFHGPLKLNECFLRKDICADVRTCVLKRKVADIERRVRDDLRSISIYSLLNGGGRKHG